MIRANDPGLRSWVEVAEGNDFPIQNLPFGVFEREGCLPRPGTAIGDQVADLQVLARHGFFDDLGVPVSVFEQSCLNDFVALGREKTRAVRNRLSEILDTDREEWDARELAPFFLFPRREVRMLLPLRIGDYTDFYSSLEHATNAGLMFRGPGQPLMPNWRYLPVGYHGRASSIGVSPARVRRPSGQLPPADGGRPDFAPTRELDFELEVALVVGRPSELGEPVSVEDAEDHIFGMVLFNDWSARDIQRWEYQPLGPFLGKNFASTISPWIVTLDALEPFRVEGPVQDPEPLPYLKAEGARSFDIRLEVSLQPEGAPASVICRSNYRYLYWNMCQQVAHHTSNGCNLQSGDLLASGTISGPAPDSYGSMLELSWRGTRPLRLKDGTERRFLEDGDTVMMRGWCEGNGVRIGFGEVAGVVEGVQ